MELLKNLCSIHALSGDEKGMRDALISYVNMNAQSWKVQPKLIYGDDFQDCLILVFGKPRTAIYAHMDSVGYCAGYDNELVKVGGPSAQEGTILWGEDSQGVVECELMVMEDEDGRKTFKAIFDRTIDRGTQLAYKPNWRETDEAVQCCYMDNRLGIWNALKVAETLEDGAIVFSAWEEVGGGSIGYLCGYLFEKYGIRQSLISDITWVTDGVLHGNGVALSLRDSGIPRKPYLNRIIDIAEKSDIPFQLEVEKSGGSDGNQIQKSHYPVDWMFIGAPESNVHSPDELVYKSDIKAMVDMYKLLMREL